MLLVFCSFIVAEAFMKSFLLSFVCLLVLSFLFLWFSNDGGDSSEINICWEWWCSWQQANKQTSTWVDFFLDRVRVKLKLKEKSVKSAVWSYAMQCTATLHSVATLRRSEPSSSMPCSIWGAGCCQAQPGVSVLVIVLLYYLRVQHAIHGWVLTR